MKSQYLPSRQPTTGRLPPCTEVQLTASPLVLHKRRLSRPENVLMFNSTPPGLERSSSHEKAPCRFYSRVCPVGLSVLTAVRVLARNQSRSIQAESYGEGSAEVPRTGAAAQIEREGESGSDRFSRRPRQGYAHNRGQPVIGRCCAGCDKNVEV